MFFYRNVSALTYIAVNFALGLRYVYNSFERFFYHLILLKASLIMTC